MKLEDVLLRGALIRVRPETATSRAEVENAAHLTLILSALWVYWQRLLGEFGIPLLHWGNRSKAALGDGRFLSIRLDTAQWHVQQSELGGWTIVARDWGLETLRTYLSAQRPRLRRFGAKPEEPLADESPDATDAGAARRRGN
jgi:hypothetical protein